MTVISLIQPFATLAVMGIKTIETRSWNTPFRGELLIHASKGKYYGAGKYKVSCRELCYTEPFKKYINGGMAYDKLPFGAIIGSVNMIDTERTEILRGADSYVTKGFQFQITKEILSLGYFSDNWYGWLWINAIQLPTSIPAMGKQGFWNYDSQQGIAHF